MSMQAESSHQESTYFITSDASTEIARLIDQDRLITESLGRLFPTSFESPSFVDVLDVACGPGGWARDVAQTYPEMQVVGIDINQSIVAYAQAFVQVQRLDNIQFRVMNALEPLDFPDEAFDFVNGRLLMSFMLCTSWPVLLLELKRILRPGGIIHLTEMYDGGTTTSAAGEQLKRLMLRAFYQGGRSFDPQGQSFGITTILESLLAEAGLTQIGAQEHSIDVSQGKPGFAGFLENNRLGGKLLQPFLIKSGLSNQEELDRLYDQLIEDMYSSTFQGHCTYLSAWGTKPLA
jgi:ubiquinone/menaquinone biosynthesis C-methylase UbiE